MRKKLSVMWIGTALGILVVGFNARIVHAGLLPGDPSRGKPIFLSFCAQCHGVKGDGNGVAAPALMQKPANFTDPNLWKGHDDAFFIHVIRRGRGVMAPYWDVLKPQQILDVLSYEKTFRK